MFIIYSIDNCTFCNKAIEFCIEKSLDYTERKLDREIYLSEINSLVKSNKTIKTAPAIVYNDEYIGGYMDFKVFCLFEGMLD